MVGEVETKMLAKLIFFPIHLIYLFFKYSIYFGYLILKYLYITIRNLIHWSIVHFKGNDISDLVFQRSKGIASVSALLIVGSGVWILVGPSLNTAENAPSVYSVKDIPIQQDQISVETEINTSFSKADEEKCITPDSRARILNSHGVWKGYCKVDTQDLVTGCKIELISPESVNFEFWTGEYWMTDSAYFAIRPKSSALWPYAYVSFPGGTVYRSTPVKDDEITSSDLEQKMLKNTELTIGWKNKFEKNQTSVVNVEGFGEMLREIEKFTEQDFCR